MHADPAPVMQPPPRGQRLTWTGETACLVWGMLTGAGWAGGKQGGESCGADLGGEQWGTLASGTLG